MEVDFTPEQEAQLSQIATHAGKDAEHTTAGRGHRAPTFEWVKDIALRAVEETTRFRAAVREGIAEADRGELIDDDEVRQWLERQERS